MKLSTKSRYGIRMLVDLARYHERGPISIGEISKRQDISVKYLEQLIRPLQRAKLVKSVRGVKGGHMLAKGPHEITMGEIVRLFEGQVDLVKCISLPGNCHMSKDCRVRLAWQVATQAMFEKLDAITIADLVADISESFS
ncbi:MAG: Rrf2 family transcriptional regulator [Deltaproteobacteria bacterium]|nr:Rrf2 family transcriptional regulator [Deltaproteobacteria bacterium]